MTLLAISTLTQRLIQFTGVWLLMFASVAFSVGNQPKRYELSGYAQGTTYQIVYYAQDSLVSLRQTDSLLHKLDLSVSLYEPSSLINRFNQSAGGLTVDEHFRVLVARSMQIYQDTQGLVDPTVKPLVDAWGFGVVKPSQDPTDAQIKALLQKVGMKHLSLNGNRLLKDRPGLQLDLNGIAQGYSVDLLAGLLESNHINNYLIELGGELRVKGSKPGGEPFAIGIEGVNEDAPDSGPIRKIIEPSNGAITTSGNYRKHHEAGGKQISHIINPLTGYPVQNELISVTVYAQDALTADGYDNGFMAMGLSKALSFLSGRKDIGAYMVYRDKNGAIRDTVTPAFKGYQK
ncbi:FAD:protein FMN transferase [Mucilaginibacter sp. CSA2-8R]|uniref:FAD:protein FMN transferase n=1 Tax=Mucilaginibacter sp. CSA2-8R TaxID=3141542 RepID=UPI00315DDC5E